MAGYARILQSVSATDNGMQQYSMKGKAMAKAKAKSGDTVQVHYTGTLDDGTVFDTTGGSGYNIYSPMEFVIGQGDLHHNVQEALIGLEPGEHALVMIACEDAYGPHFAEKVFVTPRSEIYPEDEQLDSWRWPNGKKLAFFNPRKGDLMYVCQIGRASCRE